MTNPRLATRYAKSLMDISIEHNQLDATYADMLTLQQICKGNNDFVQVLKSPIIKPTTKQKIVAAVTNGKVGNLVNTFNNLVLNKGRDANLPEIINTFIEQYKTFKGIKTVKLTTASEISEEGKSAILAKIQSENGQIDLVTLVDEKLIGGFVLQTGNTLVDASIAYDLKAIQKQFLNNDFVYKIK
jgi:F-type H+-transporting ATPase subunit delta